MVDIGVDAVTAGVTWCKTMDDENGGNIKKRGKVVGEIENVLWEIFRKRCKIAKKNWFCGENKNEKGIFRKE